MSASASASADGIPQLVTCIAGCGFRGDPANFSLCSACWQSLEKQAGAITEEDAINHAFSRAGFDTYKAARLSAAFQSVHGGPPPPPIPVLPDGVTAWRTEERPLTQYDEHPQRGTSACTYIAGFCALMTVSTGVRPTGEDWAQCILLGVKAFHAAREADPAHCTGCVAPTTAAPHILSCARAEELEVNLAPLAFEETVLLLATPTELGNPEAIVAAGHCTDFECGKPGVVAFFLQRLRAREHCAFILVRPPETYCLIACKDGSLALRDSHRRMQLDFSTVEAFLNFVELNTSVFGAAGACPLDTNCIGVYKLLQKDDRGIAESAPTSVAPSDVEADNPESAQHPSRMGRRRSSLGAGGRRSSKGLIPGYQRRGSKGFIPEIAITQGRRRSITSREKPARRRSTAGADSELAARLAQMQERIRRASEQEDDGLGLSDNTDDGLSDNTDDSDKDDKKKGSTAEHSEAEMIEVMSGQVPDAKQGSMSPDVWEQLAEAQKRCKDLENENVLLRTKGAALVAASAEAANTGPAAANAAEASSKMDDDQDEEDAKKKQNGRMTKHRSSLEDRYEALEALLQPPKAAASFLQADLPTDIHDASSAAADSEGLRKQLTPTKSDDEQLKEVEAKLEAKYRNQMEELETRLQAHEHYKSQLHKHKLKIASLEARLSAKDDSIEELEDRLEEMDLKNRFEVVTQMAEKDERLREFEARKEFEAKQAEVANTLFEQAKPVAMTAHRRSETLCVAEPVARTAHRRSETLCVAEDEEVCWFDSEVEELAHENRQQQLQVAQAAQSARKEEPETSKEGAAELEVSPPQTVPEKLEASPPQTVPAKLEASPPQMETDGKKQTESEVAKEAPPASELEALLRKAQTDQEEQAKRMAELAREKKEVESDLAFVLARMSAESKPLAAVAPAKPKTGIGEFSLPDQQIVKPAVGISVNYDNGPGTLAQQQITRHGLKMPEKIGSKKFSMPTMASKMTSMKFPGSKKKDAAGNSGMFNVARSGGYTEGDKREVWFEYLDTDSDGKLSQSEVFIGLCKMLKMEANPELVRTLRQLISACWQDWVGVEDACVSKEAFLRPATGLADILVANFAEFLPEYLL